MNPARNRAATGLKFINRNRIVNTRFSDGEFEEVCRNSKQVGASSVSEYVQWAITDYARFVP